MARSFIIERDALLEAARAASRPVEARNTIPVLSNLLFEAGKEQLTIRGTGLDVSAEIRTACECADPFSVTVPADKLVKSIETLRPAGLVFTAEDSKVTIKQDRSVRTLASLPATDFPKVNIGTVTAEFVMEGKDLVALLEGTRLAMSTEETRYYLCGVFLHIRDGVFTVVATDGVRLMRATAPVPEGAAAMPDTIISAKSVNLLASMLAAEQGAQVKLRFGERKVEALFGRTSLILKIVDGTYPDYTRVIPTQNDKTLTVHSSEIVRALRAGVSIANDKTRGVKLAMSSKESRILSTGVYGDHVDEPIDAEFGPGELDVGLNATLALPMMSVFGEASTLDIAFSDAAGPALITSPARPALTGIIVPMRV